MTPCRSPARGTRWRPCGKRAIGQLTVGIKTWTTADFAEDVALAMDFLRRHATINGAQVGLVGHRGGGFIAPLLAGGSDSVPFTILLLGSHRVPKYAANVMRVSGRK